MKAVELASKIYDAEFAHRNEISVSLSTPLGGLALLSSAACIVITKYSFKFSSVTLFLVDLAFLLCCLAFCFFLVRAAWLILYIFKKQDYKYVRVSKEFEEAIRERNSNQDASDADEADDEDAPSVEAPRLTPEADSQLASTADKEVELDWEDAVSQKVTRVYLDSAAHNRHLNQMRAARRDDVAFLVLGGVVSFCMILMLYLVSSLPCW